MSIKSFLINEQQLQLVANTLLEFPCKAVLVAVDIIRNLPVHTPVEKDIESKNPE
jgi:hypothetical protein